MLLRIVAFDDRSRFKSGVVDNSVLPLTADFVDVVTEESLVVVPGSALNDFASQLEC